MTVSIANGVSAPIGGPAATALLGQIPGVVTNDSASAGNIGEYLSTALASSAAIVVANNSATTVTALPLAAGDYDVWGQMIARSGALTVVTLLTAGINSTAAQPGLTSGGIAQIGLGAGLTGIGDTTVNVGPQRLSLAAAGTAFMMATMLFSVSTASVFGILQARRRR